jgi:PAS domain S-box-containing protein
VTWSDELHRILGLVPGQTTPSVDTYFAAVHPEDRGRAQAAAEQSLREGVLPLVDCRVVRPDGSIRHTTASSSMLFDAQGNPRRVVGSVLDRTESLEAEVKLRRTLGLMEEAQRLAQLGSWRLDPDSGELEWSQEFRRIAGFAPDAPPDARAFLDRIVSEDRARFEAGYVTTMARRQGGEIDGRIQRPDGEIRHVRIQGFFVEDQHGKQELRGTMLDVTDQVRLREELAHAQKMEAVGRLAGGIAHDFNNLLTVIGANLELLTERLGATPELEQSLRALGSASSLTRRLLAFGRKAQLSLKLRAPNELVRSITALMHRLVGDEVRLEIALAPNLPQVQVDPLEIERALVNLVVNARDAMPRGGVVRIGTAAGSAHGLRQVELSVADEGPGIPEADRPHLFEPFFTTREQLGGTGLGLATVLGTAEQHGGTVRVEPRPGGGSIFTLVLPAVEGAIEPTVSAEVARPSAGQTRALTLLVIDDETSVADVTRRMLEIRGHNVQVATQPEEALRIWAERGASFDLVICDVAMARMRGPELIARFEQLGVAPRVLFITGYSEEAVRSELGHPVLSKPFSASALWQAVSEVAG